MNRKTSTLLGIFSILMWSTTIAFFRSASEKNGTLDTAFFVMLCSGVFLLAVLAVVYKKELLGKITRLRFSYMYKAGSFLVVYLVLIYIAIGEAATREAVVVVGIINYLWPGLGLLFSVLLLKTKARTGGLVLGVLVAFAGTTTAILKGHGLSMAEIKAAVAENFLPYIFVLLAAVCWAIYSNLTRKYQEKEDVVALPILFLATAAVIFVIQLLNGEMPRLELSGSQYLEFGYIVIFPTAISYLFWDKAMKHGSKDFVLALSYFIPLASTLISGLYLNVPIGVEFWLASLLVVAGAAVCQWSIKNGDEGGTL